MPAHVSELSEADLVTAIATAYSAKAKEGTGPQVERSLGYTEEDLHSIPKEAHLGVGCGNPIGAALLQKGETVVDLGSGGGADVFLAASRVGPEGQVIGLDVSGDMIELARTNATKQGLKPPQVAFVRASIADPLPISADSVDCVISNCVINLLPKTGKESIFKEIFRVLKHGGRIAIDDIIAKGPLSNEIREDLSLYLNCVAGSVQLEEYEPLLREAGFLDIQFFETKNDLEKPCDGLRSCRPSQGTGSRPKVDVNSLVASYQISARKPVGETVGKPPANALLRWWDAYPPVRSSPPLVQLEEVESFIRSNASHFAVIDVRREDRVGGHVRGSDNWHAQTFHNGLPAFLDKYRNTDKVIFYCGSSSGRGPRCAGWYQDFLDETGTITSKAYVLQGGVKAWLAKYGNDEQLVEKD